MTIPKNISVIGSALILSIPIDENSTSNKTLSIPNKKSIWKLFVPNRVFV